MFIHSKDLVFEKECNKYSYSFVNGLTNVKGGIFTKPIGISTKQPSAINSQVDW